MRFIFNFLHALIFYLSVSFTKFKDWWRPKAKQQHKVKATKIAYKEGESYRLGECIVTLAKFGIEGKQEVAAKLLAYETQRIEKERQLTERAEEIMLMNPEELEQFRVEEWLKQRKAFNEKKFYDNQENHIKEQSK
jgi:hypothetical protein